MKKKKWCIYQSIDVIIPVSFYDYFMFYFVHFRTAVRFCHYYSICEKLMCSQCPAVQYSTTTKICKCYQCLSDRIRNRRKTKGKEIEKEKRFACVWNIVKCLWFFKSVLTDWASYVVWHHTVTQFQWPIYPIHCQINAKLTECIDCWPLTICHSNGRIVGMLCRPFDKNIVRAKRQTGKKSHW